MSKILNASLFAIFTTGVIGLTGCNPAATDQDSVANQNASVADPGGEKLLDQIVEDGTSNNQPEVDTAKPIRESSQEIADLRYSQPQDSPAGDAPSPTPPEMSETPADDPVSSPEDPDGGGFPLVTTDPSGQKPDVGLKADLTPDQLLDFLVKADQDMYLITNGRSGIRDPAKARSSLFRIIRMKQEAARRLAENESLDDKLRSEGRRGQLQALSHLASLGQIDAADELREMAEGNLDSDDPKLVSDSRLVLLGFRLEDLQNGKPGAKQAVIEMVSDLAGSASSNDVPAMMVLGRARDMLNQYGHFEESRQVRKLILDNFANSPDPQIAKLAAQVAGNVVFDGVNKQLDAIIKGDKVLQDNWSESIELLIDESPDMQTVSYLAGAALDLESRDLSESADTIYRVLKKRFDDPDAATTKEVNAAIEAHDRRTNAIGRSFDINLPAMDRSPLSLDDYRGKIVMVPIWDARFPQSLKVVPALKEIVDQHPDDVRIVGINLDLTADEAAVFDEKSDLGFPSFLGASSSGQSQGNPVAIQFGMVSMPFVVIFDKSGKVAEIDFSGRKLRSTVDRLIENEAFD